MTYIIDGIKEALTLIITFDQEIYSIIFLSITVSCLSTIIASIIGIPLGFFIGLKEFRFKRLVTRGLYTAMSLPPVVVGLTISLLISRNGPLGYLGLLYTPTAMIIAQTCLVAPIITGIIANNTKEQGTTIHEIGQTLGGNNWDRFLLLLNEMRISLLVALVTGFGRALSEVGAVMIVGGNIKGHTRVMTSYIAMNNTMGNYEAAIAMGIVLLLISFIINSILYKFVEGDTP